MSGNEATTWLPAVYFGRWNQTKDYSRCAAMSSACALQLYVQSRHCGQAFKLRRITLITQQSCEQTPTPSGFRNIRVACIQSPWKCRSTHDCHQ